MLSTSDGSSGSSGVLGLLLSDTDKTAGGGAVFNLLRVDSATQVTDAGSGSPIDAGMGGSVDGGSASPVGNVPGNWTLAFDDEFNGTSLDLTKWSNQDGQNINKRDDLRVEHRRVGRQISY